MYVCVVGAFIFRLVLTGRLLPMEGNSPWQEPHQWKDISGEEVIVGVVCEMVVVGGGREKGWGEGKEGRRNQLRMWLVG